MNESIWMARHAAQELTDEVRANREAWPQPVAEELAELLGQVSETMDASSSTNESSKCRPP